MRYITRTMTTSLLAAVAIGVPALPTQAAPKSDSPAVTNELLAEVRAAVAHLKTADDAVAAGYVKVSDCVAGPGGAMGTHYLNPSLVTPGTVDPKHPTMLTYGTSPSGKTELWAAEFFEPDVGQPTPMFGAQAFDGPMDGHGPGMPAHYDLHIWVGKHNPAGIFTPFNPVAHC